MNAQQTIERLNQILAEASKLTTQLLKMKISVAASNEAMDYNQLALAFPNLKTKNSYLQNAIKYLNEKGMWEWDEKRTSSIEKYKEIARACSIGNKVNAVGQVSPVLCPRFLQAVRGRVDL